MTKKVEKKSRKGKFFLGAILAAGSAIFAYAVSKFFCKKNELVSESGSDPHEDAETMEEENYITLNNNQVEEMAEEIVVEAGDEVAETEEVSDAAGEVVAEQAETAADDDSTKCIK